MESLNVFIEVSGKYHRAGALINTGADIIFEYDASFDKNSISLSLPKEKPVFEGTEAQIFFENILPEAEQRRIISRFVGVSEGNFFALLKHFGEECAGALIITEKEVPNSLHYEYRRLSERDFAELITSLDRITPAVLDKDYRLSLAGAQAKMSVKIEGGKIFLPLENSPSTHIIKPFSKHFGALPVNEHFCTTLASHAGLNTCQTELLKYGGEQALQVRRYDRAFVNGRIQRAHQEDFCQALGYSHNQKYEAEGGPSFKDCIDLLVNVSARAAADKIQLIKWFLFNYIVGNADAHAKNISLIYYGEDNQHIALAPFYDLVSTSIYEGITCKMAMSAGNEFTPDNLTAEHWKLFCKDCGITYKTLKKYFSQLTESIEEKIAGVSGVPYDKIKSVIKKRIISVTNL